MVPIKSGCGWGLIQFVLRCESFEVKFTFWKVLFNAYLSKHFTFINKCMKLHFVHRLKKDSTFFFITMKQWQYYLENIFYCSKFTNMQTDLLEQVILHYIISIIIKLSSHCDQISRSHVVAFWSVSPKDWTHLSSLSLKTITPTSSRSSS